MTLFLGVDVGTASVRAGLFDEAGRMQGLGVFPIRLRKPKEDFVEQSSADIWRAVSAATREALAKAGAKASDVAGVGFDATCSLVVLDASDAPVAVSDGVNDGGDTFDVVVWMDHRATEEAARINATKHDVLTYVGGGVSPEMQTPKLLWLKTHAKDAWARAKRFLDLPDYLVYRATGNDVRSLCTTVCKWTYLAHAGGWDASFFRAAGLGDLADEGFARIGTNVRPMGERAGGLTEASARDLGLNPGTPVAVAIIDAHAGGLGLLGVPLDGRAPSDGGSARSAGRSTLDAELSDRLALIGGTSTCHMAVSKEPRFVPGVWGPYFSAMVPGLWLTEGGQSATGALLDHVITSDASGAELAREAAKKGTHAAALLNARLDALAREAKVPFPAALTRDLHVLPDHHGNRSPRADPSLRGMVSGLKLHAGPDALALLYLATVQGLALGTRHILEAMRAQGLAVSILVATGGDAKNPVFLREHADATQCRVVLPREPEAVLLGSAMLGAVASGARASLVDAMRAMSAADRVIEPAGGDVARYFDAKYRVFLRMHDDQMAYRAMMRAT